MSEQSARDQIQRLVAGFPPPHGLRERIAASVEPAPRPSRLRWMAAAAVVLVALALVAAMLAASRLTTSSVPAAPDPWAALEARPLPPPPPGHALLTDVCTYDSASGVYVAGGRYELVYTGLQSTLNGPYVAVAGTPPAAGAGGMLAAETTSKGPILVRLRALDGTANGQLGTLGPDGTMKGYGTEFRAPEAGPGAIRSWKLPIKIDEPGCYALQIDAAAFSELVAFQVLPAPSAPSITTPAGAVDQVKQVRGLRPVLLPSAIAKDWTAEVTIWPESFSVGYRDPAGTKSITISTDLSPAPYPNQSSPRFRNSVRTDYEWHADDPRGPRYLVWVEPGVQGTANTVTYFLTATGLTDAEFWAIANSLTNVSA
jgi:hypothetical protein